MNSTPDRIPIIGWFGSNVCIGFVKFSTGENLLEKKRYTIEKIKEIQFSYDSNETNFWSNIQFAFFLTNLFCGGVPDFLHFSNIKTVKIPDIPKTEENNEDKQQNQDVEKNREKKNNKKSSTAKKRGKKNKESDSDIIELKKRLNLNEISSKYEWISVENRRRNKILYGFREDQENLIESKKIKVVGKIFKKKSKINERS